MINIAITGSTGFVGQNLTSYFSVNRNLSVLKLDLRKRLTLSDIQDSEVIIHLAGKAHDLKNPNDQEAYFQANTELTKVIFDAFLTSSARDFFFFSSVKAVADTVVGVLSENVRPSPRTTYGLSKLKAEEYLLSKTLPHGKRLFIIRPCMIHGPGNKGNLNLLYKTVSTGIPYPLAAFQNHRSFLSISNLAYLLEHLIEDRDIPGGIYNFSDDEPLSTNEVINVMSDVLSKKSRLLYINQSIIKVLAKLGDLMHLPLNSERLKKLTESYVVSNQKIKHALKINKLPVSSIEGLKTTIKSFKSGQQ